MILDKEEEVFEIRVHADARLGLARGEKMRIVGKRITLEGFEDFQFAVDERMAPANTPWDETLNLSESTWWVTELSTGFAVRMSDESAEDAISKAREILNIKGRGELENAMRKAEALVKAS